MTYMEIAADSFFGCIHCVLIILPVILSMMKTFASLVKTSNTPADSSGFPALRFSVLVVPRLIWGFSWNAMDMMGEWTPDKQSVQNIIDNELISSMATWKKDQDSQKVNNSFRMI